MNLWRKAGITALCVCALAAGKLLAADNKKVDLKVGDAAPDFEATDDQGKTWKSSDHVGKSVIVVGKLSSRQLAVAIANALVNEAGLATS